MIAGIGIDLTSISRIARSMERTALLERRFGPQERALFACRGNRAQTVAANFAAKEALSKALGRGLAAFDWQEVQVLRNEAGAPYFAFSGAALGRMQGRGLHAHLTLTHEGDVAAAFVVLETDPA